VQLLVAVTQFVERVFDQAGVFVVVGSAVAKPFGHDGFFLVGVVGEAAQVLAFVAVVFDAALLVSKLKLQLLLNYTLFLSN
jgi:hypothetical protein